MKRIPTGVASTTPKTKASPVSSPTKWTGASKRREGGRRRSRSFVQETNKELKEMMFSKISQLFSEVPNLNAPINF